MPDNDDAGQHYAIQVADILCQLSADTTVKIVQLDNLPDHGDIVDWVEANNSVEKPKLKSLIEEMAESIEK